MEGKNIVIEWRYAEGKLDRLPALAAELVRLKVDVIVTGGASQPVPPRKQLLRFPLSWRRIAILLGRVRRQPCATWRKHYWIVNLCPGAKRKTAGAFEGDRS